MRKYVIIIQCLLLFPLISLQGAERDSTQVIQIDQQAYSLHKVLPGETLYSIAKQYNVDLTEMILVNRIGESGYSLDVDQLLIIPLYAKRKIMTEVKIDEVPEGYITHIVKQGETLYSITRSYNGVTPEMVMQKNGLTSDTLKIGQTILIPQNFEAEPETVKNEDTAIKAEADTVVDKALYKNPFYDKQQALQSQFDEVESDDAGLEVSRGIGTWLNNSRSENTKNFYALHKDAPIGTVVKIRNLMNNRVAFVKVIGKLPENDENRNLVIKVSAATAKYLNILDERFLVELMIPKGKS